MEKEKTLKIIPKIAGKTNYDYKNSFSHTKVVSMKLIENTSNSSKILLEKPVTTWSMVINNAIEVLKPEIQKVVNVYDTKDRFELIYGDEMEDYLKSNKFYTNVNFSKMPYTDDSYIKSAIYKNSKNHKIYLYKDIDGNDRYICAPFTTEKIWSLQVLINLLSRTSVYYCIEITYIDKNDTNGLEDETTTNQLDINKNKSDWFRLLYRTPEEDKEELKQLDMELYNLYIKHFRLLYGCPSLGGALLKNRSIIFNLILELSNVIDGHKKSNK